MRIVVRNDVMDQSACVLLMSRIVESLLKEDVDAFVSLFLPDAQLILPNASCVGIDSIRSAVQGLYRTYENISIDVEQISALDNGMLVQWRWQDNTRSTGEQHETDSAIVLELEGTKIRQWREYHAPALHQNDSNEN